MRQPTRAAWVRMLKFYEAYVMNPRLQAGADDDERSCLFRVHDMIRLRASGGGE